MHYLNCVRIISLSGCVVCPAAAQRNSRPMSAKRDLKNVGSCFSGGLEIALDGEKMEQSSLKTISIKLESDSSVAIDTERLRLVMSWTGALLKSSFGRDWLERVPRPVGQTVFKIALLSGRTKDVCSEDSKPPVKKVAVGFVRANARRLGEMTWSISARHRHCNLLHRWESERPRRARESRGRGLQYH